MRELPNTPLSLIAQIQRPDEQQAWERFWNVYGPVIVGYLRSKGLQDADVRDIAQDAFRAVVQNIQQFDPSPERGRFRNWLFTIVRHKMTDYWRRIRREPHDPRHADVQQELESVADRQDQSAWDREYKQRLLHWAADQVRGEFAETTWNAFWLTAVQGRPPAEVADGLGLTVSNVYVHKSRVLARLREKIKHIEGE
jgi:RNA polymerase sigma-70 factor (ECF subfamily)